MNDETGAVMRGEVSQLYPPDKNYKPEDIRESGILGWNFLAADRRTAYGEYIQVQPGQLLRWPYPVSMCDSGYHACLQALDAARFGRGPVVQRVMLWGEYQLVGGKVVAEYRLCLGIADVSQQISDFVSPLLSPPASRDYTKLSLLLMNATPGWEEQTRFETMMLDALYGIGER